VADGTSRKPAIRFRLGGLEVDDGGQAWPCLLIAAGMSRKAEALVGQFGGLLDQVAIVSGFAKGLTREVRVFIGFVLPMSSILRRRI
jgi:hypothetical protein